MFEKVRVLKMSNPRTNEITNIFVKNAEEYTEIMSNAYVMSCIIAVEEGYIFRDIPEGFKQYDCSVVCLTEEEKNIFEQMLDEETDEEMTKGAFTGSFHPKLLKKEPLAYVKFLKRMFLYLIHHKGYFYYGEHIVRMNSDEINIFETQFEDPYAPKVFRRRNKK